MLHGRVMRKVKAGTVALLEEHPGIVVVIRFALISGQYSLDIPT